MTIQALELSKRPHTVIATPGRLRAHLLSCTPPSLTKAKYLILDEADRLLASGFESELKSIIGAMPKERQTLVFSATLTSSLVTLETLTNEKTLKFDLTSEVVIPSQLKQQYLFIPAQVKLSYLVCLLQHYIKRAKEQNSSDELQNIGKRKRKSKENEISNEDSKSISFSIVIFVNTCKRCQEISETLLQLQVNNVCLHSVMTQSQRMNSLSKFRNQVSKILICTDVASRGLDIPNVDVVLNYDLPNVISDYIHRVGRTARAQKKGTSISFVTQYDVDMVHAIEEHIHSKLELCQEISEDHVVKVLNQVAKANRSAELKLLESGFEDKIETVLKRKKTQKKKLLRRAAGRLTGEVSATGK